MIQDLDPDDGGLAVNGGATDNMNVGEVLIIKTADGGQLFMSNVKFFDGDHLGIPTDQFNYCGGVSCGDVLVEVYNDTVLVGSVIIDLLFTMNIFDIGLAGDEFRFIATTNDYYDEWYIAAINVPEPATLALLGYLNDHRQKT